MGRRGQKAPSQTSRQPLCGSVEAPCSTPEGPTGGIGNNPDTHDTAPRSYYNGPTCVSSCIFDRGQKSIRRGCRAETGRCLRKGRGGLLNEDWLHGNPISIGLHATLLHHAGAERGSCMGGGGGAWEGGHPVASGRGIGGVGGGGGEGLASLDSSSTRQCRCSAQRRPAPPLRPPPGSPGPR